MGRRRCPACAERVRSEATICRFCGNELAAVQGNARFVRKLIIIGLSCLALAIVAIGSFWAFRSPSTEADTLSASGKVIRSADAVEVVSSPIYPELKVGETLEWTTAEPPITRQAGPYVLQLSKHTEDGGTIPALRLSAGSQEITVEGEAAGDSSAIQISVVTNRAGAVPAILVQSYTGGAHCCNHLQLAGFSNDRLKIVDLGQWDGERISPPSDISGDGVADFVFRDNRFLYAFAPYAFSYAPPQIINVIGGRVVEVSGRPAFRQTFAKERARVSADCQPGLALTANGACPGFVASAARSGNLDDAWSQMIGAYDATVDWKLPTGCLVKNVKDCPADQAIVYKSYPEALQAFLIDAGYLSKSWVPPEQRRVPPKATTKLDDSTA